MTTIADLAPTSITGIKRLGNRLKKTAQIPLSQALDRAAIQAGYDSYTAAVAALRHEPWRTVRLVAHCKDGTTPVRLVTHVRLRASPRKIATIKQLQCNSHLGSMIHMTDDLVAIWALDRKPDSAGRLLSRLGRLLQFMDATGLKPTRAAFKMPDRRPGHDLLPGRDHERKWIDPSTRKMLTMDQPYMSNQADAAIWAERVAAGDERNLDLVRMSWGSIHADEAGTIADLVSVRGNGYPAADVLRDIKTADPAVRTDRGTWTLHDAVGPDDGTPFVFTR